MKRVIIVGAGYGGLRLFEKLARSGHYEVCLFDRHPYHYLQTDVYKYIANMNRFTDITVDLHTLQSAFGGKAAFRKEAVTGINFDNKYVTTEKRRMAYDYLVLATGAVTNFDIPVEGLKKYSHELKNVQGAMRFKQAFESALLERVETECEENHFSIVVIGAGLSGVEIAAEMARFASVLYKKNYFLCDRVRITLVSSTDIVLPGNDDFIRRTSHERLEKLGIDILTGRRAKKVESTCVILDDGTRLDSTFTLFAGGIKPAPLHEHLDVAKDRSGCVIVNRALQIEGAKDAFALGDCAHIEDAEGKRLPATADMAETSADLVYENLKRLAEGKEVRSRPLKTRGTIVALGGKYSAARVGTFHFKGFLAYLLKWGVEHAYLYRLRRLGKAGSGVICKTRNGNGQCESD